MTKRLIINKLCCGSWTRTNDLRVMSPTSYHCSIPRCFVSAKVILFRHKTIAKLLKSKINRQQTHEPLKMKEITHDLCIISFYRGKRGIRTPGTVTRTPHFECGPFDHSGSFPKQLQSYKLFKKMNQKKDKK